MNDEQRKKNSQRRRLVKGRRSQTTSPYMDRTEQKFFKLMGPIPKDYSADLTDEDLALAFIDNGVFSDETGQMKLTQVLVNSFC